MRLDRCLRLMPHHVSGGGFFVAVLEKVGDHDEAAGKLPPGTELGRTDGATVSEEKNASDCLDISRDGTSCELAASAMAMPPAATATTATTATAEGVATAGTVDAVEPLAADQTSPLGLRAESEGLDALGGSEKQGQGCECELTTLHALGGAAVEHATMGLEGSACVPLFVPPQSVVTGLVAFFGGGAAVPVDRLVTRSPTARQVLLVSRQILELLRADRCPAAEAPTRPNAAPRVSHHPRALCHLPLRIRR